jgi:hypothetical protein
MNGQGFAGGTGNWLPVFKRNKRGKSTTLDTYHMKPPLLRYAHWQNLPVPPQILQCPSVFTTSFHRLNAGGLPLQRSQATLVYMETVSKLFERGNNDSFYARNKFNERQ